MGSLPKKNLNTIDYFVSHSKNIPDCWREIQGMQKLNSSNAGIISDYQAGAITAQDKEQLVNEILGAYQANGLAEDEQLMRWAVGAARLVASVA